jgi:hypothetical protein
MIHEGCKRRNLKKKKGAEQADKCKDAGPDG